MFFNSIDFLLFFVAVIVIYYVLPSLKLQKIFLLLSSYFFYASWEPVFLLLLLVDTFIIYFSAIKIDKLKCFRKRGKSYLLVSIVLLLLPLLFYKYLNFLLNILADAFGLLEYRLNIQFVKFLLPVGISFFTFQAIGYLVDIYKQKVEAERSYLDVSLFLGFFPQISAGPIGRASALIPQFKYFHVADYEMFVSGFKVALWGFFMKLVVGDRAGIYVDTIFSNYDAHSGLSLILATFMYSIQIYCDFAGYSFIAIGVAQMMGFQLQKNFERPYFALSITDFWRRWHISLSTWFRDYLYIPLGGNRVGKWRGYWNVCFTFLISGLWHGAAYNFIIWGGLHGLFQVIGKITKTHQEVLFKFLRISQQSVIYRLINLLIVFTLCSYAWMIFRANRWNDVIQITKGYLRGGNLYVHQTTLFFFFIAFIILFIKDFKDEYYPDRHFFLNSNHTMVRYFSVICLSLSIILLGVLGGGQFIYFQF